jgi:hypothetical protein
MRWMMNTGTILIYSIFQFIIIYFAVRMAIKPLINESEEVVSENNDLGLVKLRDIEVFNNDELEEVIKLYQNKGVKKNDYERYAKVLSELKEMEYLSEEQYSNKLYKLKEYFKVN